jgi:hypothetical protein
MLCNGIPIGCQGVAWVSHGCRALIDLGWVVIRFRKGKRLEGRCNGMTKNPWGSTRLRVLIHDKRQMTQKEDTRIVAEGNGLLWPVDTSVSRFGVVLYGFWSKS